MRIVVALGGNALLRRGEPMTAANQRRNVAAAAEALAPLVEGNELVISHGNGPQVGLLALQAAMNNPRILIQPFTKIGQGGTLCLVAYNFVLRSDLRALP